MIIKKVILSYPYYGNNGKIIIKSQFLAIGLTKNEILKEINRRQGSSFELSDLQILDIDDKDCENGLIFLSKSNDENFIE